MMSPSHDIAFDNNTLSDWAVTPGLRARVVAHARATRARLVIPLLVLCETAKHTNPKSRARVSAVEALYVAQPVPVVIGADLHNIMRAERDAPCVSVPAMSQEEARELLRLMSAGRAGPHVTRYLALDEAMRWDAQAKAAIQTTSPSPLVAKMQTATPADAQRLIPELIDVLDQSGAYGVEQLLCGDLMAIEAVRAAPHRHPATILAAAGLVLHHCGVLFPQTSRGEQFPIALGRRAPLLCNKDNDWIDLQIAASAAHARVFVTNDQLLRDRVDYVGSKGWTVPRTASLEAWLDGRAG